MAKPNKHMSCRVTCLRVALISVIGASTAWAMPDVQVNGLLPNQAVVTINGQQRILKAGKTSPEGITLLSSDSKQASFTWQGQHFERALNKDITSKFSQATAKKDVRIERGRDGHFFAPGLINGRLVHFLVDTGAFTVAISMNEADRLGLDWRNGKRFLAGTAGGETASYSITLASVTVGDITLNNVSAAVIVANMNEDILLGMSFLEQTQMREEDNALILTKKF